MTTSVCWFRRDARLDDHPALHAAAGDADRLVALFVLDPRLLGSARMSRRRLAFLADALADLDAGLRARGGWLVVRSGDPTVVVPAVAREAAARSVHWHRDHTPYAAVRDEAVLAALSNAGIHGRVHDGTLVRAPGSVLTKQGTPFKVFTPFARQWRTMPVDAPRPAPSRVRAAAVTGEPLPTPAQLGAGADDRALPGGEHAGLARLNRFLDGPIEAYPELRDQLAADATSRLSADLHFGTVSARTVWSGLADSPAHHTFATQLVWREFYAHVLAAWPEAAEAEWNPSTRGLPWRQESSDVDAWRDGRTGYPIVDAAMRQLDTQGWMHNRGRLIVASFLCKDLLVDWRIGEAHFLRTLVDGDWASNNGGWQWAAGTGTDAQPFFRVFNPVRQGQRFDPQGTYVRRHVPELARVPDRWIHEPWRMPAEAQQTAGVRVGVEYPAPIVDHDAARRRALDWFARHRRRTR